MLVAFEGGDPRRPYVVGGLWNGTDAPPESMDGAGKNDAKVIRSRNGVKVTLDDTDGQEKLDLETPGGQKLTLKDGPGDDRDRRQQRQLGQARAERDHRHASAAKVTVNGGARSRSPPGMVTVERRHVASSAAS